MGWFSELVNDGKTSGLQYRAVNDVDSGSTGIHDGVDAGDVTVDDVVDPIIEKLLLFHAAVIKAISLALVALEAAMIAETCCRFGR